MVKADGCVAVHADGGAYKPLNWMNAPNTLVAGARPVGRHQPQGRAAHDHDPRGALPTPPTSSGPILGCARTASSPTCRSSSPPTPVRSRTGCASCGASTRRRSARSTSSAVTADGQRRRRRSQAAGRDRRRRAAHPLRRAPPPRLHPRSGARGARRPGRQAAGAGARRGPWFPLGGGRLRHPSRPGPRRAAVVLTGGAGSRRGSDGEYVAPHATRSQGCHRLRQG